VKMIRAGFMGGGGLPFLRMPCGFASAVRGAEGGSVDIVGYM
jgi:hypothetical protein